MISLSSFVSALLSGSTVTRLLSEDGTFRDLLSTTKSKSVTFANPLQSGTYQYSLDGDVGVLIFHVAGPDTPRFDGSFRLTFTSEAAGAFESDSGDTFGNRSFTIRARALNAGPVNISNRALVAAGNVAVTGFVITSSERRLVLVRAIGPGLEKLGVPGGLADPFVEVYANGSGRHRIVGVSAIDFVGRKENIATASAMVGAFPLDPTQADSAEIIELPPGAHTIVVGSASGKSEGIVLTEVYFLP